MDDISKEPANVVEQANLTSISDNSNDVDYEQVIEEINSFAKSNPDIENAAGEQLQHGLCELTCALLIQIECGE